MKQTFEMELHHRGSKMVYHTPVLPQQRIPRYLSNATVFSFGSFSLYAPKMISIAFFAYT